ncbi:IS110 family transposase [Rhodanobacter sp. UC4436_H3]
MTSSLDTAWLALDIGAKSHAWASEIAGEREQGTVDNTAPALLTFLKGRLRHGMTLRVLVEATGVYYLDVALQAQQLGAEVMVINPRVAHHFAQALNQRNKTDRLDAKMLLECLQRMPFLAWVAPSEAHLQLRSYGRFLVQLTEANTANKNRLHALQSVKGSPRLLRDELKRMIASTDKRIARIRTHAIALIREEPHLNACFKALCSFTGIADVSAVALLSELITLPPTLSSRACVSHAGLDPRVFESGTSVHKAPRISRHGNKYLRRALFLPAMSATVHDPRAKAFKERLVARGKKPLQATTAVMRKMLTAAWAVMKNPALYDSALLYADLEKA